MMSNSEPPPPRRPFQFGISTMLWITALVAVLCGALAGMCRERAGAFALPRGFFILMAIAAPVAIMIGVSLILSLRKRLNRRR